MKETSNFPNYVFDKTTGWRMDLPGFINYGTRVLCLYRVSTGQQLYRTENNEADIPMQRKRCRQFAEQMGWTIVYRSFRCDIWGSNDPFSYHI